MPKRYVYLSAVHRWVSLGQYVAAVKRAKAEPETEFNHGLTTWEPTTGADVVRQFRAGIHDRINQGVPAIERGVAG